MGLNVLYPDASCPGPADIEESILGEVGSLSVFRARAASDIPVPVWQSADAVVCHDAFPIDQTVLDMLDSCRIIVRAGVGFDHIDTESCRARGLPVCNTPDYGTTDVADHAIGLMLALARGIVAYDRELGRHGVVGWDFARVLNTVRLAGRVFGIIGLGRIGIASGIRARAFGMSVTFHDPYVASGLELALGFDRAGSLEELLGTADMISLHAPLTPETRGMIGTKILQTVKPTAFLINTARGAIIDTDALLDALRAGQLAGAALDVLPIEPPNSDDRLFAAWLANEGNLRDRLILTPHAAFYSGASLTDLRRKSAETVRDFLRYGVLRNCVNGFASRSGAMADSCVPKARFSRESANEDR